MNTNWKAGLALSASMFAALSMHAVAEEAAAAEEERVMDAIVVVGEGKTYSTLETSDGMAELQAPLTSALAVIDNLPGVTVNEGDTFGFDDWSTTVTLRGFQTGLSEQQVGITIDGLPNGNSNYGGGAKANRYIDTQNMGAVEVSQGTADIASRSNEALGGTLNFTTQDAFDEQRVRFSAAIGDNDAQRMYARYDSGLFFNDTTKLWVSASSQSATDWMDGSAENQRDHVAAKIQSQLAGFNLTSYFSYDDTHEDNYQRLWSQDQYDQHPLWDELTAEWTGVPYVDQNYRRGWSTKRKNSFFYLKADKDLFEGLNVEASIYRHDNSGRGDWLPPYLVGAGDNLGQFAIVDGDVSSTYYFTDKQGNALSPIDGCNSSITWPWGGANPEYDINCYAEGAVPVGSYRHTHYQKNRTGITSDANWETTFGAVENTLRAGIWYEDATRDEYRDWHKVIDSTVGFYFDEDAYWVQYNRSFPQTTFKWYVADEITFGDFKANIGLKQFNNELERQDLFDAANADENFTVDSESDVLLSAGFNWAPSFIPGLEAFVGYAENFKALSDGLIEDIGADGFVPNPETSENYEIGVRYFNDRLRASVVYFDTTFDNRLLFVSAESSAGIDYLEVIDGGYLNAGGIESSGVETWAEFNVTDNLSVYASYTYNDSTILGTGDEDLDSENEITPGNLVPGIPEHMLVLSADFTHDAFYGGASVKYVGERAINTTNSWFADEHYETDLYVGVGGDAISESLEALDFRLTVNNLLDSQYLGGIAGGGAWIASPRTTVLTVTADF